MKLLYTAIVGIAISASVSDLAQAACTPAGNTSKAACRAPVDVALQACLADVARAREGNDAQGAERHLMNQQIAMREAACNTTAQNANAVCDRDCPLP